MKKHILFILLLFILLTILMTFPLVFKITTHIPGFFSTDESYGALWESWRIKYSLENNLSLKHFSLVAHPFGLDLYSSGFYSYLRMGWYHLLSFLTTPVLTYNLQIFINLILNGLFIYLLVFYLTKNRLSAVFSGIIFSFCPYQFMRVWQHLGLSYNQWIPLVLFGAILLKEKPSRRSMFILGLSLFLLYGFDHHIMYFGSVCLALLLIYVFCYNWKVKFLKQRQVLKRDLKYIGKVIAIWLFVFVILLPQFLPIIKNTLAPPTEEASMYNPYKRPFRDLTLYSARPLSYFLPAVVHPLFGKFTQRFIESPFYGVSYTEHTLYLGWIALVLAFIAFRRWRRRREDFYIGFFIFLAVAAWLFSQPPWWRIGPIKIFMPSYFMYKILPMVRAYCRFGIVVMLAVAVLAGFGLKFILQRFKSNKTKIVITVIFCTLVLFEFWNYPPFKVIDVNAKIPGVYSWIESQPGDFAIAEYPLDVDGGGERYMFYQIRHKKPIINGTEWNTPANRFCRKLIKLSEVKTAQTLFEAGVKYAIVHKDRYLATELLEWVEELDKIPQNHYLKLIKSDDKIDVYEIRKEPLRR